MIIIMIIILIITTIIIRRKPQAQCRSSGWRDAARGARWGAGVPRSSQRYLSF